MRYCCLSFDDGRKDFYTNVFPILKREGIPATLNVITEYIANPTNKDYQFASGNNEGITVDHAKEIQASGIEIASHSHDHTNTIQSIHKASRALASYFPKRGPFGLASPCSHIHKANISEYEDLLDSGTVRYIRSGNQLKRDGMAQLVLFLIAQLTKSPFLFYRYQRSNYIDLSKQYAFYPSVALTAAISAKQITGLLDRMKDNEALILMFHSVLQTSDRGYGKDKWYTDIEEFKHIISYIQGKKDIRFITNAKLHELMENTAKSA